MGFEDSLDVDLERLQRIRQQETRNLVSRFLLRKVSSSVSRVYSPLLLLMLFYDADGTLLERMKNSQLGREINWSFASGTEGIERQKMREKSSAEIFEGKNKGGKGLVFFLALRERGGKATRKEKKTRTW